MALLADGNLDDGVAALLQAYEILPHPNVLYNVARAYAEAGRYEEALEYFNRYADTDPLDREEVQMLINAVRSRLDAQAARATVEAAPTQDASELAQVDEIQALEDSASQIAALAEASQSEGLRQRAERLRLLAAALREGRTTATDPGPSANPDGTDGDPALGEGSLQVRESRSEDTYEESIVSASRRAESPLDAPNSTTTITSQDIRMSGLYNVAATLRRAAGVSLMQLTPGDYQVGIRGFNRRLNPGMVTLIDGRSVYLDFLGYTSYEFLPLSMDDIERIEVIRGPASALYGADAMTGIVNIIMREPGAGRSYITGGFGSHGQALVATGASARVDRFRFRLSGGYGRADQFALEVGPDRVDYLRYGNPNTGFEKLYFNGEVSYRFDGGFTLRGGTGVIAGEQTYVSTSSLRQFRGHDRLFAQSFLTLQTPWGVSARVYWNRYRQEFDALQASPGGIEPAYRGALNRQDVIDTELVVDREFDIGEVRNHFIGGLVYRFKELDWNWLGGQVRTQHHGGVFLQDTLHFDPWVELVVSVRGDLHPVVGPQVSPRGSVVFHPTEGQSIRVTGGAAFRSPTFNDSYLELPVQVGGPGTFGYALGNLNNLPERLISAELGYMNQMSEYLAVELNGYYNVLFDRASSTITSGFRLADYVARNPYNPDLEAFNIADIFINVTDPEQFQQIGGELGIRVFPVEGLDLYANYAINETSHLGGPRGSQTYDKRTSMHMVNAGFQYRAPFGLDLSADFSWQSEQWWQEGTAATTSLLYLPAYATLNARVGWRLLDDHLELAVIGTNLIEDQHREHPYGQPIDRRFMGTVTVRF